MITACLSCLTAGGHREELSAAWKTNWENSGGAKGGRARQAPVCLFFQLLILYCHIAN